MSELTFQKLLKANNVVTVPFEDLKLTILSKKQPIVVVDTEKWEYSVVEKFADFSINSIHPSKFNGDKGQFNNINSEMLSLDAVLERISNWKERFSTILPFPEAIQVYRNHFFQRIIIYPFKQDQYLWCDINLMSYSFDAIDATVMFNDELQTLIDIGKQNSEEFEQALKDLKKGQLVFIEPDMYINTDGGVLLVDKKWFDQYKDNEDVKKQMGDNAHTVLSEIFAHFNENKFTREEIEIFFSENEKIQKLLKDQDNGNA